jgi:hypothetical protein
MENNISSKLKDKKIAYAILLMGIGMLFHFIAQEYHFLDEELRGFFMGFFYGGGIVFIISVFVGKRRVIERKES